MKLLHLISGGDIGGAKTHVLSLLNGLNRTETVHLICFMEGEFADEARRLGIPTTVIEGKNLISARRRILAMIRHDGYQLIHCHGARANMMGILLKKKAGIPVITTVHSDYRLDYMGRPIAALTYGNVNKLALRRFDAWIGVSDGMVQLLISRGFDPQRIFPLYNGIDFSEMPQPAPREEYLRSLGLELQPDTVVFGIAARISPVKDMTTLIRAFAQAVQHYPNIRLAVAGVGEQETEIRALAAELCPQGTVCFVGWLKDINSFYHALDVNLLTSLSETFPYALTEGARMKCATIASNVGGVPYLIEHGETGLLFEPKDVKTLAEHMQRLAENAELRQQLGQALYEKAKRDFSLDAMVEKQKGYYEIIVRRGHRTRGARDGVVICGAYGRGNGGDNAILEAIIDQLYHIDPDLPLCALSRSPKETRMGARINAVYSFRLFKTYRLLRRTKLYISGGGTLMQDATSTRSLLFYLFSIRQAKRAGCRVMLYGCGVGPINRRGNRSRAARVLQRCADVITVRDRYSETFLQELGVTAPRIRLTADPALLIDPPDTGIRRDVLAHNGIVPEGKYAMLSVRPWEGFSERLTAFVEVMEYTYRTYGLTPVLYAMEPRQDLAVARAVAERLRCPHLVLEAGNSGEEIITTIRRMSIVISMRLHALVFASGQNVPVVGIVYDPKVSGFLDDLGQELYLPLREVNAASICDMVDAALAEHPLDAENILYLRSLAKENEALARELLKEGDL